MKKFVFLLIIGIFISGLPITVLAQTSTPQKTVVLARDQVIDGDYFAAGETIIVSGTVNGDAYVAGGNVIIEGNVSGDVLAAGGSVNIRGTVGNNVRVVGGNINITGNIGRNLSVAGGNANISDTAKIGGSMAGAVGNLSVFGPIANNMNLGAGQATLGSTVGGNVNAAARQIILTSNGSIGGDLTYWSDNAAQIQSGAAISGQTSKKALPQEFQKEERRQMAQQAAQGFIGFFLVMKIIGFISSFIVGLLFINLFPFYTKNLITRFSSESWKSLGIGLLIFLGFPILAAVLLITVIGIPLAIFTMMIWMILLYLSHLITSLVMGSFVLDRLDRKTSLSWAFVVGLFLYFIISFIPVLGKLFLFILGLMAIGTIFTQHLFLYKQMKGREPSRRGETSRR